MLNRSNLPEIPTFKNVTAQTFRQDIYPLEKPALLKGYVSGWPAVQAARKSTANAVQYLAVRDKGKPVSVMYGPKDIDGQFFYSDDLQGVNFTKKPNGFRETLSDIQTSPNAAIYIQSEPIPEILTEFALENSLDIIHPSIIPRIWIGNRLTVQTHFDLSDNIACVVAGRRRFTLFPPSQTKNMYIGPFEKTLAGPPISMVRLDTIDESKFPNFGSALERAMSAELEAGDAVYIPYFWWHHVESLDPFNILVNYWWNDMDPDLGSPFDAMLHALLAFGDMPERQRKTWQYAFDHLVFKENGNVAEHLPKVSRGILGAQNTEQRKHMRKNLVRALASRAGLIPPMR